MIIEMPKLTKFKLTANHFNWNKWLLNAIIIYLFIVILTRLKKFVRVQYSQSDRNKHCMIVIT